MYSSVFSWRQNNTAESSSLRSGASSVFHVDVVVAHSRGGNGKSVQFDKS